MILKFAEPVWFGREELGEEIIDLLPAKFVQLSADEMVMIGGFENGTVPELTSFGPEDERTIRMPPSWRRYFEGGYRRRRVRGAAPLRGCPHAGTISYGNRHVI